MNHADNPLLPREFRVSKIARETHDSFTMELDPAKGAKALHFASGQFNMLYAFGVGEAPISISGNPGNPRTLTHTIRVVGPVTKALHGLGIGDWVGVRGPFGTNWPVRESMGKDIVIVTGGIGLAPLRPAMYEIMENRGKFGNVVLLYGARTPNDILYEREVKKWRSQFDLHVNVTVDRAAGKWKGNVGVVTTLIPNVHFDPYQATALICGPEVMIRYTVIELRKRGVASENIFVSMERNMKCGIGHCGHCQLGPHFVCKDGPVFRYNQVKRLLDIREV